MTGPGASMLRGAQLSDCRRYRYTLTRDWGTGPAATFIMLNPSTADATVDDPTIRRCVGFAHAWGCGRLIVGNLYALRATDPQALWNAVDPVGPDNDATLTRLLAQADGPLVAAWGGNARADRVEALLALPGAERLACLGVTKAGAPRHPLYLPATAPLQPWPPRPTPTGSDRP